MPAAFSCVRSRRRPLLQFRFAILQVLAQHPVYHALHIGQQGAVGRLAHRNLGSRVAQGGSDLVPAVYGRVHRQKQRLAGRLRQGT